MKTFILSIATEKTVEELSVWGMILKGGWLMIPIFIISLITVYIFCERYLQLRKLGNGNATFMDKFRSAFFSNQIENATTICREEDSPMSRILIKGLTHLHLPALELRAIIENKANLEVAEMEKGLSTLATCSGMAPMIGFLGTVVGMIQAFYDMALAGSNINITLLSRGIYTAMITTVAGLIVGIIAHFAYNALTARIDKIVNQIESNQSDFMEMVYELKMKK